MSKIKKAAAPKKPRPTARGSRGPKLKKKLLSLEKKKAPNTNPRNKKLPLKNKRAVENEPQPVHDEPQEAQEPPQEVRSELDDDVSDAESSNLFEDEIDSHKKSLSKLADTDPEFYKFLRDNDKRLLDFDVSDSEDDDEKQEDAVHTPGEGLEVASDESDFEDDSQDAKDSRSVTLKLLKQWQSDIQEDRSNKTIGCLIQAFHAALLRVSNEGEEDSCRKFKVDGSSVFNAIIQLCVLELGPAIRRFLGMTANTKVAPHKCKRFSKVKALLRGYFGDLLKLLGGVSSANILTVLLKHLHYMSPFLVSFPNTSKPILKRLIHLWGKGDDTVRVVAFLCILRITNNNTVGSLDLVLRSMYVTYVKNAKFVTVGSLPAINFMRRSLVEMFSLDLGLAYKQIFLYVRQLAIHLRNAIKVPKKETIQAVYNWQFVNSLRLWAAFLSAVGNKPQIQPLIYPFVQVCIGTIRLIPTSQYYPLRFHVVQILIELSRDAQVFVPILPFILEVLNSHDFNKKHKKVSMKPMQLTCLLRLSKSQLSENGCKDAFVETVYGLLLEYLASQSHSIAFPDLSLFCVVQLKQFVAKCRIANYTKKMRQVLDKIVQNSDFIDKERKGIAFEITSAAKIAAWESSVRAKSPPLSTYFESWNKLRTVKRNRQATDAEKIGDYNLPSVKRVRKEVVSKEPANPFPSDDEDDGDQGEKEVSVSKVKRKRVKSKKRKLAKVAAESDGDEEAVGDVVEDFNDNDW